MEGCRLSNNQVYGTVALLDKIESKRIGRYPNWPETRCPEIVLTQKGCWLQVRAPHSRDTQNGSRLARIHSKGRTYRPTIRIESHLFR